MWKVGISLDFTEALSGLALGIADWNMTDWAVFIHVWQNVPLV